MQRRVGVAAVAVVVRCFRADRELERSASLGLLCLRCRCAGDGECEGAEKSEDGRLHGRLFLASNFVASTCAGGRYFMTGDGVSRSNLPHLGNLTTAFLIGKRTAGMEHAAGRRGQG